MAEFPREYQDGFAKFALGLMSDDDWRMWLMFRARDLAKIVDRSIFRIIKKEPLEGISLLMQQLGITLAPPYERPPVTPDGGVSDAEYDVYTALFDPNSRREHPRRSCGVFEPETGFGWHGALDRGRLEFDEQARRYRVASSNKQFGRWARSETDVEPWRPACPEFYDRYVWLNRRRWPLEKRFVTPNGVRFPADCSMSEYGEMRAAIRLSRVGFSDDGRYGLVFLNHAGLGEYAVLERIDRTWQEVDSWITWHA